MLSRFRPVNRWIGGPPNVLGASLGHSQGRGGDSHLPLEGEYGWYRELLIGVWRWMGGCRISMLRGGPGYRCNHLGSLLIRFGSMISETFAEDEGVKVLTEKRTEREIGYIHETSSSSSLLATS
jgi:hypothetical protein